MKEIPSVNNVHCMFLKGSILTSVLIEDQTRVISKQNMTVYYGYFPQPSLIEDHFTIIHRIKAEVFYDRNSFCK